MNLRPGHDSPDPATALKLTADMLILMTGFIGLVWWTGVEVAGLGFLCLLPLALIGLANRAGPFLLRWLEATRVSRRPLTPGEIELGAAVEWPHAPIRLDGREREGHTAILGRNGSGKSTLMKWMIEQDLSQHRPIIVIDPHLSLVWQCAYLAMSHDQYPIVLEPAPRYMNTLNLLETRPGYGPLEAARTVTEGLIQVYLPYQDEVPVRIYHMLGAAAYMLAAADEGYTVLELQRWLLQKSFREYVARKAFLTTSGRGWLESSAALAALKWLDSLTRTQLYDHTQSTWTRLFGLLSHPDAQRMLGSSRSTFDFGQVRNGVPLLVGIGDQGLHRTGHILGSLIITWVTNCVLMEPSEAGGWEPIYLYADELAEYSPESFERLLRHARKQSLRMAFIAQAQTLLHPKLSQTVMANISSILVSGLSGAGVEELVREMGRPDEAQRRGGSAGPFIELQRQLQQMASAIRDLPKHEFYVWRASRPGPAVRFRTGRIGWNQTGTADAARAAALQWRGKSVIVIDEEIRERTSKLDAQFGPLHDFGERETPREMAPW